tara:strand:+ start:604 stop:912 length:309 start_codon:yes stop_codon:yes gene_type:complete
MIVYLAPREEFDQFLLGVTQILHVTATVYDEDALLEHFKQRYLEEGLAGDEEDAWIMAREWLDYNVIGVHEPRVLYVSKHTLEDYQELEDHQEIEEIEERER